VERPSCDIAIVGGGLAGGLVALALARRRPDLRLRVVEEGAALGGNHRWSWFASDLSAEGTALMDAFPQARWEDGYEVTFPSRSRALPTPYRSLASKDFAETLWHTLPGGTVLTERAAASVDAGGVTLAGGERIAARAVVDARGFVPTPHLSGGWQVFMGRTLRLPSPHGVTRPRIMDAAVEQLGGYRFIYVLPLSERDIFVEDTYYQDTPLLDRTALAARLNAYCAQHGWEGEVTGEETGVLPVITGGDFAAFQTQQRTPGVAVAGARGGFTHPLTSYTLPFAVETALALAVAADLPGPRLAEMLEERARRHWHATRFYRLLGTMLFGAAEPEQRWRVFERFYGLRPALIERFYAGRSTLADRARILCGRPPVPIGKAMRALRAPQPPLRKAA
jgi:lycopene beta-cyclase